MPLNNLVCACGAKKGPEAQYCGSCRRRWRRAGFPASGPPPPMDRSACGLMGAVARIKKIEEQPRPEITEADAAALNQQYDVWLEARNRRTRRPAPIAASLVMCVAARDAEGVRRLLNRYSDLHSSLLVALAATANPALAAMIARQAPEPVIRRAARTACNLIPAVAKGDCERAAMLIKLRAARWNSYAALAIVLAESVIGEQLTAVRDAA